MCLKERLEFIEKLLAERPHLSYNEKVLHETVFDTRIWIKTEKFDTRPTLKEVLLTIESCIPWEETLSEVIIRFLLQYEVNWRLYVKKEEARKTEVISMTPRLA